MSFDLEMDDDLAQRRLQRLEHRYRRAQNVLAGAQANYGSLREARGVGEVQLQQALRRVQRAQQELADIHSAIELAEHQTGFA
jgi:chromosome segregation ATPase